MSTFLNWLSAISEEIETSDPQRTNRRWSNLRWCHLWRDPPTQSLAMRVYFATYLDRDHFWIEIQSAKPIHRLREPWQNFSKFSPSVIVANHQTKTFTRIFLKFSKILVCYHCITQKSVNLRKLGFSRMTHSIFIVRYLFDIESVTTATLRHLADNFIFDLIGIIHWFIRITWVERWNKFVIINSTIVIDIKQSYNLNWR